MPDFLALSWHMALRCNTDSSLIHAEYEIHVAWLPNVRLSWTFENTLTHCVSHSGEEH